MAGCVRVGAVQIHSGMKLRPRGQAKGRSAGLVFAGALALVLAGVVLLVAINNRTAPGRDGQDLPVDISTDPPNFGSDVVDIAAQTTGRFQAVDRNDPNRVEWELLFERLDPMGAGVYRLREPRAWFYFKDGQAMHVRADAGTIKKPSATDSQIENGTFEGNVVASVFRADDPEIGAARPGGGRAVVGAKGGGATGRQRDADRDEPWLLAVMQRATFDSVLLELSTAEPVRISTRSIQFDAQSLLVRGNQVDNRLEYLTVSGPGLIRYAIADTSGEAGAVPSGRGGAEAGAESDANEGSDAPPTLADAGEVAKPLQLGENTSDENGKPLTPSVPTEQRAVAIVDQDLYRAVFLDEVIVTQTGRKLTADALEVWTRVVDNRIPDAPGVAPKSAVAKLSRSGSEADLAASAVVRRASEVILADASAESAVVAPRMMSVSRVQGASAVATDGASDGAKRTLFAGASSDVVLSWRGTLTAAPLESAPAELPESNHLHARFTASKSVGVRFRDAGTGGTGRSAILDYAVTTRELRLRGSENAGRAWVNLPGSGLFLGDDVMAYANDGRVKMAGAGVLAAADRDDGRDEFGPQRPLRSLTADALSPLSRVEWSEQATFLFHTRDETITSELRTADFVGGVEVYDHASKLLSEQLSVCFDHTLCGAEVEMPEAGGTTDAGATTQASASPIVRAFGAGSFEHRFDPVGRRDDDPERLVVTWTKSMFFEEPAGAAGHIRCDGETVATATGPLASDVLKSNRLHLYFQTPAKAAPSARAEIGGGSAEAGSVEVLSTGADAGMSATDMRSGDGPVRTGLLGGERTLDRAEAMGSVLDIEGGKNASIESRRYTRAEPDSQGAERKLAQIIYLDGPRIIASETAGTLRVPDAGQAVVFDQRENEGGKSESDPLSGDTARGTTRFRWKGDFALLREASRMEIRNGVEMVHQPPGDEPWARLTCDRLTALLVTPEMAVANPSLRVGRLASSLSEGDVLIESADSKRIVAERASYDVSQGVIEASSLAPNVTTFFDDQSAAPLAAKRLRWDLARDRVEIVEPAPVTVPR